MLNPEVKKKWLDALRSGEYKQGQGSLKKLDEDPDAGIATPTVLQHCCLGVLSEVCEIPSNPVVANDFGTKRYHYMYPGEDMEFGGIPSFNWLKSIGMPDGVAAHLAQMNDEGMSFGAIANWIEEKL